MSRYTVRYPKNGLRVVIGFDRPMQGYYLTLWSLAAPDNPILSNLDFDEPHPQELEPFIAVLTEFGLELEPGLLANLKADRSRERAPKHPYAELF